MITILSYLIVVGLRPAYLFAKLTMWLFVSGNRQRVDEGIGGQSLELQSAQELDMAR